VFMTNAGVVVVVLLLLLLLTRAMPNLLASYRTARAAGLVSGPGVLGAGWQATAAAAQQLPGSYLAYEFATSRDGVTWQPVRFRGGLGADRGFGFQGVSEQLLLGRLAAAGAAELSDNMWLLHVADMLLEVS
jgi:hypothetical protein